nr:molybdopterin-dependent oxidoreductase [Polymorphobacter sp.]
MKSVLKSLSRWSLAQALFVATAVSAGQPAVLTVAGTQKPLALSAAELATMPRGQALLAVHGKVQMCEGVWVADVLARAGVPSGESVRGEALSSVVVMQGLDGYQVVFSLGEVERSLGNGQLLIADRCGGNALPAGDGPVRIVAAGEKRGARSVRGLARITLVPVTDMGGKAAGTR